MGFFDDFSSNPALLALPFPGVPQLLAGTVGRNLTPSYKTSGLAPMGGLSTINPTDGKPILQVSNPINQPGVGATFQYFHPTTKEPLGAPLPYRGPADSDAWLATNWPPKTDPLFSFPTPTIPKISGPAFDPSLSVSNLLAPINEAIAKSNAALDEAGRPIGDVARGMIEPLLPGLKGDVNEYVSQQVAANQSDAMKRGLTGSSTESLGAADIRGQGAKVLEEGIKQLLFQALPIAQQEKQTKISAINTQMSTLIEKAKTSTSIRGLISDEQFKTLDLNQKAQLFEADAQLQTQLKSIDQSFQEKMLTLQQQFEREQNAQDRAIAQQQMDQLNAERSKARTNAMLKSIFTGLGAVGGAVATKTPTGAYAGAAGGAAAADAFGFLMN